MNHAVPTHEVLKQGAAFFSHNVFSDGRALRDALAFPLPHSADHHRVEFCALLGDASTQAHARLANLHHHALLGAAIGAELHVTPWAQP